MTTWNAGSIGSVTLNAIDGVPATISGLLPTFVEEATEKIKSYNGDTVDPTGFDAKYMPAVLNFTLAQTSIAMNTLGTDAESQKLGDWSIKKGTASNVSSAAKAYMELFKGFRSFYYPL